MARPPAPALAAPLPVSPTLRVEVTTPKWFYPRDAPARTLMAVFEATERIHPLLPGREAL